MRARRPKFPPVAPAILKISRAIPRQTGQRNCRIAPRRRSIPVNKNDLIQKLSDHTGLAKNDAAKAVDGVFDLIAVALKEGDEVRLTGFGVFVVATRAGGKGRNPQTGEEITIKPSKQPRFRPGKQLKDSLN